MEYLFGFAVVIALIIIFIQLNHLNYHKRMTLKHLRWVNEQIDTLQKSHGGNLSETAQSSTSVESLTTGAIQPTTPSMSITVSPSQPEPSVKPTEDSIRKIESSANSTVKNQATTQAATPHEDDFITKGIMKLIDLIKNYFQSGNLIVRLGIIILFFGAAFLVKYAADHALFPIELRLASAAIGSILLIIFGWRLRLKNINYAVSLQAGGIGIFYLITYASFHYYHFIDQLPAFGILILLTATASMLAVLQNVKALAILAIFAGFAAPMMVSTGQGNHVVLFSYYTLLNIGILLIAWFKQWRFLNLLGFIFTFGVGTTWGVLKYKPEFFLSTEPFLIIFFLLFNAIAILFAREHVSKLGGFVDGTLVFGTPLIAFALQTALVMDYQYGIAISSFALGFFYLSCATLLWKRTNAQRLLAETYLALGTIFTTLVIPFLLDNQWTAAAWALEGIGLVWIGIRQNRMFSRLFGQLLPIASLIILLSDLQFLFATQITVSSYDTETSLFLNSYYLTFASIAISSFFISFLYFHTKAQLPKWESFLQYPHLILAAFIWIIAGLNEVVRHYPMDYVISEQLIYLSYILLSSLLVAFIELKTQWKSLRFATLIYAIILTGCWISNAIDGAEKLMLLGFVGLYALLFLREKLPYAFQLTPWLHGFGLLTLGIFTSILLDDYLNYSGWEAIGFGLINTLLLFACMKAQFWPFTQYRNAYAFPTACLFALLLTGWSVVINFPNSNHPAFIGYFPILNPLDLTQLFVILVLFYWAYFMRNSQSQFREAFPVVLSATLFLTFLTANIILLRTLHHWYDISYESQALAASSLVQTNLSIFWTILSLAIMLTATRLGQRIAWIVGMSLLAIVVIKLFAIDLKNTDNIARIISFVVVGILLLIIGFFSPIPPKKLQSNPQNSQ